MPANPQASTNDASVGASAIAESDMAAASEPKARTREQEHTGKLLACSAWQEIEVWMLAGYKIRLASSWAEVRADCDPKERYAEPLLKELNSASPGGGRKAAMRRVTVDQLMTCDELKDLAARLGAWLGGTAA